MKSWQAQLGFWGFIVWLSMMFNLEQIETFNPTLRTISGGYVLGFITAISGFIFWEIIHGRFQRIVGPEKSLLSIISSLPLLLLVAFGLFGFINQIINNMPWVYNVAFVIAGIVVQQGVIPVINDMDGIQRCN